MKISSITKFWQDFLRMMFDMEKDGFFIAAIYSTLRAKTDKLEEAVNRELNVTRS